MIDLRFTIMLSKAPMTSRETAGSAFVVPYVQVIDDDLLANLHFLVAAVTYAFGCGLGEFR